MQKSVAIYCDDTTIYTLLRDAVCAVGDALDAELDVKQGGHGDIVICTDPYNYQAVSKLGQTAQLSYFLYWGQARGEQENIFDYKFTQSLRIGHLMDRISSLLQGKSSGQVKRRLAIKNWNILFPENTLKSKSGDAQIELTDTECQLLRALYLSEEEGISKQDLLDSVWGYHKDVETHTLETHIYRLRQKLEADPSEPNVLITTDAGYVLQR